MIPWSWHSALQWVGATNLVVVPSRYRNLATVVSDLTASLDVHTQPAGNTPGSSFQERLVRLQVKFLLWMRSTCLRTYHSENSTGR